MQSSTRDLWLERLREFRPNFVRSEPALALIEEDLVFVLHGSTTNGIDDEWSDLDLWAFCSEESLICADEISASRFFEFEVEGKKGHANLVSWTEAFLWLDRCNIARIAELRQAVPLEEHPLIETLLWRSTLPMTEALCSAWVRYHYVEFRSEHRACDSPIERNQPVALLLAVTRTIEHALRCALVIDGVPYPYVKWLMFAASKSPVGAEVANKVTEVLDLLACDDLRKPGPEKNHPLSLKLREIRGILIKAIRNKGLDEPWLSSWWLYLTQAREGVARVSWPEK